MSVWLTVARTGPVSVMIPIRHECGQLLCALGSSLLLYSQPHRTQDPGSGPKHLNKPYWLVTRKGFI